MNYLSKEQIEEIRQFDTPTVCNAIEKFKLRSKIEGFTSPPKIKAIYPDRKPVVATPAPPRSVHGILVPRKMKRLFTSTISPFSTVHQFLFLSSRILMKSR